MKKATQLLIAMALFLGLATTAFAQIVIDGDASDWDAEPVLIDVPDNQEGFFPEDVGAIVTDRVDVKAIKAKVENGRMYIYTQMWAGPVWPNRGYEDEDANTVRNRGYYHWLFDLDNDSSTGWKTSEYEGHLTTIGYYRQQGLVDDPAVGAELLLGLGLSSDWSEPGRAVGIATSAYMDLDALGEDFIFSNETPLGGDSASVGSDSLLQSIFVGSIRSSGHYDSTNTKSYWTGYAWGDDFVEVGFEIAPVAEYYASIGKNYFAEGQTIGVCAFLETPIDGWGVEMTGAAFFDVPALPMRPNTIQFDGDDSDWAAYPVIATAPDNQEGFFPEDVGATTSDRVDLKDLKAFYSGDDDVLYFMYTFYGSPVFPNSAYVNEDNNTVRHRGYYKLWIDFDNDPTTGRSSADGGGTSLGYYISQGLLPGDDSLGGEIQIEVGYKTEWTEEGSTAFPEVSGLDYWAADQSGLDTLAGDIFNYAQVAPDSASLAAFDGYLESEVPLKDGSSYMRTDFWGHAWGEDFLEVGVPMSVFRDYFKERYGKDWIKNGDVIAVCGNIETPIDGWGNDYTPKGIVDISTVGVAKDQVAVVEKFNLSNNYPNPFNPSTKIQYSLPTNEFVSLKIYDIIGREVATLVNKQQSAGVYDVSFNASNLTSGIYFYKIDAGSFVSVKKMMLLK